MASLSRLKALFLDVISYALNNNIVHSEIKKAKSIVLVDKNAHQRETITK